MITTLQNWKTQLTAKGLSHNDVVRLLRDAGEEIDALKGQCAVDREAAQALSRDIADIAAALGIRDSAPNLGRETVKAVKTLVEERDALRAALQCAPTLGTANFRRVYETWIDNARRVLGEDAK